MDTALLLSGVVGIGIAAQWLAWYLKQPSILFLLLIGIIIGPVLGVFDPDLVLGELMFPFISLGVAIILFEGSLTLEFDEIKQHGTVVQMLVSIGVLITIAIVALSTYLLFDVDPLIALLFGALVCVTGPTVIMPLLRSVRPNKTISNILKWEGIIIDPIGAIAVVLGNHDINLIAVWRGAAKLKSKDKTAPIFAADDCDELLEWLRRQPILAYPDEHTVLVHAGIPPHWSIEAAATYAKELESQLQGSLEQLDELLPNLYSKKADKWHSGIEGFTKMRAIANYFTRMRLCQQDGLLEFDFNAGLDEPMPTDFLPWFEWQVPRTRKILFGHWAALQGEIDLPHARALDGGCVWGNCLLAYRLSDGKVIASSAQCPSS